MGRPGLRWWGRRTHYRNREYARKSRCPVVTRGVCVCVLMRKREDVANASQQQQQQQSRRARTLVHRRRRSRVCRLLSSRTCVTRPPPPPPPPLLACPLSPDRSAHSLQFRASDASSRLGAAKISPNASYAPTSTTLFYSETKNARC